MSLCVHTAHGAADSQQVCTCLQTQDTYLQSQGIGATTAVACDGLYLPWSQSDSESTVEDVEAHLGRESLQHAQSEIDCSFSLPSRVKEGLSCLACLVYFWCPACNLSNSRAATDAISLHCVVSDLTSGFNLYGSSPLLVVVETRSAAVCCSQRHPCNGVFVRLNPKVNKSEMPPP